MSGMVFEVKGFGVWGFGPGFGIDIMLSDLGACALGRCGGLLMKVEEFSRRAMPGFGTFQGCDQNPKA